MTLILVLKACKVDNSHQTSSISLFHNRNFIFSCNFIFSNHIRLRLIILTWKIKFPNKITRAMRESVKNRSFSLFQFHSFNNFSHITDVQRKYVHPRFDRRKMKCVIWLRWKQTKRGQRNGMKKEAVCTSMALQIAFGRPRETIPKNYEIRYKRKKRRGIRKSRSEEGWNGYKALVQEERKQCLNFTFFVIESV